MNRKQAEHILDAYVRMSFNESTPYTSYCDKDASDALRDVILDAMVGYKTNSNYPSITVPYATWVPAESPTYSDGTPKVTCTGVDPASATTT